MVLMVMTGRRRMVMKIMIINDPLKRKNTNIMKKMIGDEDKNANKPGVIRIVQCKNYTNKKCDDDVRII